VAENKAILTGQTDETEEALPDFRIGESVKDIKYKYQRIMKITIIVNALNS